MFEPKEKILTTLSSKPAKSSSAVGRTDELMDSVDIGAGEGSREGVRRGQGAGRRRGGDR